MWYSSLLALGMFGAQKQAASERRDANANQLFALFALYRFEHRFCTDSGTEDSQVKRLLQPSVPRSL